MEYPPRKFHPDRKRMEDDFGGKTNLDEAKRNSMLRDVQGLDGEFYTQADLDAAQAVNDDTDLIEDMPTTCLWRTQNLVHFDIDPKNSACTGIPLLASSSLIMDAFLVSPHRRL